MCDARTRFHARLVHLAPCASSCARARARRIIIILTVRADERDSALPFTALFSLLFYFYPDIRRVIVETSDIVNDKRVCR